jgi:flagellar basal body rod protein FlgB
MFLSLQEVIMRKPGYILFITFCMLALCTTLVSLFVIQGMHLKRFSQALLDKQQVFQFAISCVSLQQSFLTFSKKEVEHFVSEAQAIAVDQATTKDGDTGFARLVLERVLPVINQKQTVQCSSDKNGVDADIEMILFCENGKININSLYDIAKQKFYDEGYANKDKKVMAKWIFDKIAEKTGKPSLFEKFETFMKQRKSSLNDVTELLQIKEFAECFADKIFYTMDEQKNSSLNAENKELIYLTDIFTVASEQDSVQPWLLSPSVCVLLGIQQMEKREKDMLDKTYDASILSHFKKKANWATDWDLSLKDVYGVSYSQIPNQARLLLTSEFSANIFSLLLKVTIGNVTTQIYALLKQRRLPNQDIFYDVIKVYHV